MGSRVDGGSALILCLPFSRVEVLHGEAVGVNPHYRLGSWATREVDLEAHAVYAVRMTHLECRGCGHGAWCPSGECLRARVGGVGRERGGFGKATSLDSIQGCFVARVAAAGVEHHDVTLGQTT